MNSMKNNIQRTFIVLWLLCLVGCSESCREWYLMDTVTAYPCFNSGCLILGPDNECSKLNLEICRSRSGVRIYLDVLLLKAPLVEDDPSRAILELLLEGEEPLTFYPYILDGSQRLLFTDEVSNYIIELLLAEQTFVIQAGRDKITVIPDNFAENYQELMDLEIEDSTFCPQN